MRELLISLLAFFSGAVPYAYILVKIFTGKDIRSFGKDGNPGTTNAFKAGGWKIGILVMLLDYFKAALPVQFAVSLKIDNTWLVIICCLPILGHIFSPFLKFKGGKGIATTFGSWGGLTIWEGPSILGATMVIFTFLAKKMPDIFKVIISMLVLLIYFILSGRSQPEYFIFWIFNIAIILYAHKKEITSLFPRKTK